MVFRNVHTRSHRSAPYAHPHMCTHIPHIYTHTCACTHTHTNTCTHMHMPPHAHIPAHRDRWVCTVRAQRMGTLSKSVCKLLLLSPWISQQESDVSVVQAQGGLSEALSLGWESPSSQLYWLLRHSPCPPSTQVSPEAEPEPILVQLVMESLLMHHLEDGKGFALLFMTVFPGPGTAPGI